MNTETLKALEQVIEPYRNAGFFITSQSDGSITLARPKAKFSYLLFVILLLVWPLALLYLISFNNQKEKVVCLRVTSRGEIEEMGDTLSVAERDSKHDRAINSAIITILSIFLIVLTVWVLHMMEIL